WCDVTSGTSVGYASYEGFDCAGYLAGWVGSTVTVTAIDGNGHDLATETGSWGSGIQPKIILIPGLDVVGMVAGGAVPDPFHTLDSHCASRGLVAVQYFFSVPFAQNYSAADGALSIEQFIASIQPPIPAGTPVRVVAYSKGGLMALQYVNSAS